VVKSVRRRAFLGTLAPTGRIAAEAIAENTPDRTTPAGFVLQLERVDPGRQANCTRSAALTHAACELSKDEDFWSWRYRGWTERFPGTDRA
jgi:hypothetical protein